MDLTKYGIVTSPIPGWLQPPKLDRGPPYHEACLNLVFDGLMAGRSVAEICREEGDRLPEYKAVLKWIHSDPELKKRYHEAQEIGVEAYLEEADRVAKGVDEDGNPSMEDVQRSALRIGMIKWKAERQNRRYRETKNIDITETFDITKAMADAAERLERIRAGGRAPLTLEHEND